jgi:DNA-binding transcriptional LysR family regulator
VSHEFAVEILEARGIPFKVILTSHDMATHFSLCESGRGVMVFPERFVPDSLRIADWLPEMPTLDAGIFVREGFEPPYLTKALGCLGDAFKPS